MDSPVFATTIFKVMYLGNADIYPAFKLAVYAIAIMKFARSCTNQNHGF